MTHLPCPVLGTHVPIDATTLLSTHGTSTGASGYARCVCDGVLILARAGGNEPWNAVGHSLGARQLDGRSRVTAGRQATDVRPNWQPYAVT